MDKSDLIAINLIQHFMFCKRQWALMELENVWIENADTIIGHDVHDKAHDMSFTEKRGDKIITRSLPIVSYNLGLNGVTDIVEYNKDNEGITIQGFEGRYRPYLVEYKKGKPKKGKEDIMQLVAQVVCIEEMHNTKIYESAIYYKKTNKRFVVEITDELRTELKNIIDEMKQIFESTETPKAERKSKCNKCSLFEACWPRLTTHKKSVINYIKKYIEDEI